MEMKESWLRAIDARVSRRSYLEQKISPETAEQIQGMVDRCNAEGGLHIHFVENGVQAFKSFKSSYGMFSGVQSYFAMAGEKAEPHLLEAIGYYGELLVLECTALGLGTCWVAGTFDRSASENQIHLSGGDELACVVPVGHVNTEKSFKEKAIYKVTHGRKSKTLEEFITPSSGLPDWVAKGVEAVMKAPSAINKQPVHFAYENGIVKASVENKNQGIDLGIAKAHFELGAWGAGSKGKWALQKEEYIFQN